MAIEAAKRPRGKPFQSGKEGWNPRGRRPGFGRAVRDWVDPDKLIRFALAIVEDAKEQTRDRLAAATFLADRGWGKPDSVVHVHAQLEAEHRAAPALDTSRLTLEQKRQLHALLNAASNERPALVAGTDDD